MGYDVARFENEVDEEVICPICFGVLEEPLNAPQCEHVFCKRCINEWLIQQYSCPIDREPVTPNELKPAPRILRNLLSRLRIMCDYASFGCEVVVKLESLEAHRKECDYNPEKPIPCERGCGLVIPKKELNEHNCVKEVRVLLQSREKQISEMQNSIDAIRRDISLLKVYMQDCVTRMTNSSVPAVVESLEQDETMTYLRWATSLRKARVTRWRAIISTPDSVFLTRIRQALNESGCPPHIATKLMENSHERKWPPALRTLETRQTRRRYYENYVCLRIPGQQAVVILAIDNPHMNDDMLLEPGFVMIFALGIE